MRAEQKPAKVEKPKRAPKVTKGEPSHRPAGLIGSGLRYLRSDMPARKIETR